MVDTIALSQPVQEESRSKRLKAATHASHDRLDKQIMSCSPFASRTNYGKFVEVQRQFHREIDALYEEAELDALLPDLPGRRRLKLIEQDLVDLDVPRGASDSAPVFGASHALDLPSALGWLYVAEGSNLGAAFLLKEAYKLDLSDDFGARHLAAAPEGRGLHWRTFTQALDGIELTEAEEQRVVAGAVAAFMRVRELVTQAYA